MVSAGVHLSFFFWQKKKGIHLFPFPAAKTLWFLPTEYYFWVLLGPKWGKQQIPGLTQVSQALPGLNLVAMATCIKNPDRDSCLGGVYLHLSFVVFFDILLSAIKWHLFPMAICAGWGSHTALIHNFSIRLSYVATKRNKNTCRLLVSTFPLPTWQAEADCFLFTRERHCRLRKLRSGRRTQEAH